MLQTLKRLFLVLMTILAISTMVNSLVESWQQPQIQSRLELYQVNLLLQAAQDQLPSPTVGVSLKEPQDASSEAKSNWQQLRQVILGEEPIKIAQKQYQTARQADQSILEDLTSQLPKLSATGAGAASIAKTITQLQEVIPQLDLALGILYVELGNRQGARETWQGLLNSQAPNSQTSNFQTKSLGEPPNKPINKVTEANQETAQILLNLWSDTSQSTPKSTPSFMLKSQTWESTIKTNLTSWFRDHALNRLYTIQNNQTKLQALQQQQNSQAEKAIWLLLALTLIPSISGLLGLGLLLFLGGQVIIKGQQSILLSGGNLSEINSSGDDLSGDNLSGSNSDEKINRGWVVPWDGETIWEVLVGGFFFVGQLLIPYIFSNLPLGSLNLDVRGKAIAVLVSYLLMSAGTLLVLYLALRRFLPLPAGWFPIKWRSPWLLWGFGGYLVAIPLVIGVSLINQMIWQGKGGSNPILPLALQGNDPWSFLIFSTTASLAAPIFEETIFRGFLLPSLTRYLPLWGAIVASSLLFAIAHLSLSEVLPLTVLGMVLGVVYWRCPSEGLAPTGNLLASMLLHSLWNSGTLISLYILSIGGN